VLSVICISTCASLGLLTLVAVAGALLAMQGV
jgi:hypothetical protein